MESKRIGIFRNAADAVQFAAGQTIFKEGDPATLMYVVQSGEKIQEARIRKMLPRLDPDKVPAAR